MKASASANSMAMAAVWRRDFGCLKPRASMLGRGIGAEVVEVKGLKRCCVGLAWNMLVRKNRMRRSRILLAGHMRDRGRYELLSFGFLFGFRIDTMIARFHMA